MQFERTELIHLAISILTITTAFYIVLGHVGRRVSLLTVFLTVGLAFTLHEFGHKATAQNFGCIAVYRAWLPGLVLALAFAAFTGFVFAAPGAVYIHKEYLTIRENGLISLSGPMMNFLLAFAFFGLLLIAPGLASLGFWGFKINMFLGMFNMLPFPPLDGYKVLNWNKVIWVVFFGALVYFTLIFDPVNLI
ncbi:MAG: site-2 protease family protein [archaeon]